MSEQQLHRAVANYLRLALKPPVTWTTFPAGGGGKVRGAQLKAMGLQAGWPDILILAPLPGGVGTRVLGIELKAGHRGRPTQAQLDISDKFFDVQAAFVICRSLDEVELTLKRAGIPNRISSLSAGAKAAA